MPTSPIPIALPSFSQADLAIRTLLPVDTSAFSALVSSATAQDRQYFHPFPGGSADLEARLARAKADRYFGVFRNNVTLVAFHMLRGLDEGYLSPVYGVFVSPEFRRMGIARLTLGHAISTCLLNNWPSLRLKVYRENKVAFEFYLSAGFQLLTEVDEQVMMEFRLGRSSSG